MQGSRRMKEGKEKEKRDAREQMDEEG